MGNVSTNVYAKFHCALLRIKKALRIFGPGRTDTNNKKKKSQSGVLGPAFRVQKMPNVVKSQFKGFVPNCNVGLS